MSGRPWTPDEIAEVRKCRRGGQRALAKQLNRTFWAVRKKRSQLREQAGLVRAAGPNIGSYTRLMRRIWEDHASRNTV